MVRNRGETFNDATGAYVARGVVPLDSNLDPVTPLQEGGSVDTELPAAAALTDDTANPTVPGVGAFGMVFDGTTWDRVKGPDGQVMAGNSAVLVSTPTLSVAGAYASGDYIGPSTTPASFTSAVRLSGGGGTVKSLVIADKTVTAAAALELWLFTATFTAPTDNAAWAITDAEALTCLGVIQIDTARWYASSNNKIYSNDQLGLVIKPGATTLFYALVARGTTPTWADGDLQLSLGVLQD